MLMLYYLHNGCRMNVSLIDKLKFSHDGDQSQLEVIFSSESKLIVEAPAGYGKTKTMVSRVGMMLAKIFIAV